MTLVPMPDLLRSARERRGAIAAFNVITLEHIEAIVSAGERADSAVILQISQNCVRFHGALAPLALAALSAARCATSPVTVHLDHANDEDLVQSAVDLGIPSVMFDASSAPYHENVARTRAVVESCHRFDVAVEAQLGEVGGKDGIHAPGTRTDPAQARAYVEATGADSLAVAVGTSHAKTERDLRVDVLLVERLREASSVPLVLHGASSLSDDEIGKAVRAGITKVNIATHINRYFSDAIRAQITIDPRRSDPRRYLGPARLAMSVEAERLLGVLRSVPGEAICAPAPAPA